MPGATAVPTLVLSQADVPGIRLGAQQILRRRAVRWQGIKDVRREDMSCHIEAVDEVVAECTIWPVQQLAENQQKA